MLLLGHRSWRYSSPKSFTIQPRECHCPSGRRCPLHFLRLVRLIIPLKGSPHSRFSSPGNHSVTQSAFTAPCQPLAGGFDSGNILIPSNFSASDAPQWNLTITNTSKPLWFYCKQLKPNPHCDSGMVGSINAPLNGTNTYEAFQASAKNQTGPSGVSVSSVSYEVACAWDLLLMLVPPSLNSKALETSLVWVPLHQLKSAHWAAVSLPLARPTPLRLRPLRPEPPALTQAVAPAPPPRLLRRA